MIRPALPYLLVAVLAGLGVYGILARRHAVLVLVGVELLLGAAGLLLVTVGQTTESDLHASAPVLTLFLITIAAAEVVVALAVLVALHRARGHVDLAADLDPRAVVATSDDAPGETP
ncbi:NADH-quinone oxidoreductase subunit NuoK [Ornithinimicrobium cerasi]|uniref:NADH-quinone oxidoreductase subunit NuoK n=1 Tax=Ornithinimicrobium cerasi TaxID=2248773 RepID=UPI000F009AE0|nr:NADH-quinone oxidoreductase subunit NuoK [Ornithinimicrobium cerasi]